MAKPDKPIEQSVKQLHRRDFLRTASMAATAAIALPGAFSPLSFLIRKTQAQPQTDPSTVVVVKDAAAHSGSQIVANIVQVMMDEAIRRLAGMQDTGEAYRSFFPGLALDSVIGIKVNCINASLATHPLVVTALTNGLQKMKIGGTPFPANNIIIWDRTSSELQAAGYTINSGTTGVRCFGTNTVGYNNAINLNCAGYTEHPSRILTDYADYNINVAVLKNASGSGLTLTLKNEYGMINSPSVLHNTLCNPYIPAVNQQIRDVLSVEETLFIVDAIFGCYTGGPMGSPNLTYDGLFLGRDRVAVDSIGRSILEEYNCPTLANAVHVDTAAQAPYNLGVSDLAQIRRLDVENPSQAIQDLNIETGERDIRLDWSAPEYTGTFSVLRSREPGFSTFQEIGLTNATTFLDRSVLTDGEKQFYRVLKTW